MNKKSNKNWSIQISSELRDLLKEHCKNNGWKMSSFIEKISRDAIPSKFPNEIEMFYKLCDPHRSDRYIVKIDGIFTTAIKRISRPSYSVQILDGNVDGLERRIYKWNPIEIDFYNFIDSDISQNGFGCLNRQIENIKDKVFNIQIKEVDMRGYPISTWNIINARITGIKYSDLQQQPQNRDFIEYTTTTIVVDYESADIKFPSVEERVLNMKLQNTTNSQ